MRCRRLSGEALHPATAAHDAQVLSLTDDELHLLVVALVPVAASNLSATCKRLHRVSQAGLADMRERAIDALVERVGSSRKAFGLADALFLENRALQKTDCALLGLLAGSGELSQLRALDISTTEEPPEGTKVALSGRNRRRSSTPNAFGDEGMVAFTSTLARGVLPSLELLYLSDTILGPVGVGALAGALARGAMPSLSLLNLNRNVVTDAGLELLLRVSESLGGLTHLWLQHNCITDAGMLSLATLLASGALPALRVCVVGGNPASDMAQAAVAQSLATRGTRARLLAAAERLSG